MTTTLPTIVHAAREPYDLYIGRPSKWGNPFHPRAANPAFRVTSRDEAVVAYDDWVRQQPDLIDALPELMSKRLGCWCGTQRCHGYVLIRLLQELQ